MSMIIKQIETIERIDQLIRMQATGPVDELAERLNISKTKLYRIINIMKSLGAPVLYDVGQQSFVYEEAVGFRFGFYVKEPNQNEFPSYA